MQKADQRQAADLTIEQRLRYGALCPVSSPGGELADDMIEGANMISLLRNALGRLWQAGENIEKGGEEFDAAMDEAQSALDGRAGFDSDAAASVRALEHRALLGDLAADDAARWRAVLESGRIRVLGSAGIVPGGMDTNPAYAHIGLELWTLHEFRDENAMGRRWLIAYADKARGLLPSGARGSIWVAIEDRLPEPDVEVYGRFEHSWPGQPAGSPSRVYYGTAKWIDHNGGGWTHHVNGGITHWSPVAPPLEMFVP